MAQQRKIQESEFNINDPRCIRCNSKNLKSLGRNGKRRRYSCQDCRRCFKGEIYTPLINLKPLPSSGFECPRCNSLNTRPYGKRKNGKQTYICRDCGRSFVENPKFVSSKFTLSQNISPEEMFAGDIWDIRVLGLEEKSNGNYTLTFSEIEPNWLKIAVKKWIKHKSSNSAGSTLLGYLVGIRKFSSFITEQHPRLLPQDINRSLMVDYFNYLLTQGIWAKTRNHYISHLKLFLEASIRFDWLKLTKETLIYPEDYPKIPKYIPRYIPEIVIQQMRDKYHALPQTVICMIEVLLNTGMRVSELRLLKINCIEQDSTGTYWIKINQEKMKKEIFIPIDKKLSELITSQQNFIKSSLGDNWQFLFCDTKNKHHFMRYKEEGLWTRQELRPLNYFEPSKKKACAITLRGYLTRFVDEMDESGKLFSLSKLHRFRHTHGTDLINNGVPQHIVQKRLGHASPAMTAVYAHIHDKTMKQEMEKFWDGRVLNNQGEVVVSANPELDTVEMQWIKKNMKAQTLPDGFCGFTRY
jgi:integrase/recombinase XerD